VFILDHSTPIGFYQSSVVKNEEKSLIIRYDFIIYAFFAYLMGQAELYPGFYTLSLVYWSVFIGHNKYLLILITIATGFGLLWTDNIYNLHYLIAGLLGLAVYKILYKIKFLNKIIDIPVVVAVLYLFIAFIITYFEKSLFYQYLLIVGESIIIYILIILLREGLREFSWKDKRATGTTKIALFIVSGGIFLGLSSLEIFSEYVINILILLIILGIAYTLGVYYSTMISVLYGIFMVSMGLVPILSIIKYIIFAVINGFFEGKKKIWFLMTILLSLLVYSGFAPTLYNLYTTTIEMFFVTMIFLIIPGRIWRIIFSILKKEELKIEEINIDKKIDNMFKQQLLELSSVFSELSVTFKDVLTDDNNVDKRVEDFAFIFRNKVCRSCYRNRICWEQEYEDTYNKIKLLMQEGEKRGALDKELIEDILSNKCSFSAQIISAVKSSFELFQINNFWVSRLKDRQVIVSEQLKGISEIIKQFSKDSSLDFRRSSSFNHIVDMALKEGLEIYDIEVYPDAKSDKYCLNVKMEQCSGNRPCEGQLLNLIESECGYSFRILEMKCGYKLKDKPCEITYGPKGKFNLEYSLVQVPKSGNISGDTFLYKPLKNGNDLIVLSDGMGVGEEAASESETAVNLLERIIESGFEQELAIKTINSALFLRNQKESFTTLDIAFFNTFTGEIIFNKIGAVVTFIKRGWEVFQLSSSSLPAGILEKIQISSKRIKVEDNDFIIMLSDGALDSRTDIDKKEEWFKQTLQNSSFDKAQELADYLLEIVYGNKKIPRDDITIAVFKVKEIL
jgi:stage II sporulation protein E